MKKFILGVLAAAAVIAPIAAVASPASAAAPAAKATGSVTWNYQGTTGSVVFDANDKTGGTLDYTDSTGQTLHGVVTVGSVVKTGNKVTFDGTITDSNVEWNLDRPFTGVVIDVSTSGRNGDQIGLFVDRDVDDILADVTGGNLTVH